MTRFLQPLWLLLTTSTDKDLRQMIEYLKQENRILRSKLPDRITVTARERNRLIKFGSKIGGAIREVISIVSYRTFCRWKADANRTTHFWDNRVTPEPRPTPFETTVFLRT